MFRLGVCGESCLEVDAREEGVSYTLWRQRLCGGRPSYARVCPHYSLSLYLFLVSSYLWTVVSALMKLI